MKNQVLFFLLFSLLGISSVFAQEGMVTGRVRDLITENGVDSSVVTLLTVDSVKLSSVYARVTLSKTEIDGKAAWAVNPKEGAIFRVKVPAPGRYILRCMAGGYLTTFFPVDVKYTAMKSIFDVGDLYLQEVSTQIGEAVVTGTKIRMFYKGDTLVYNASAFQLPEGSMLDDLVCQLPGAELRDGGIYVNGRLVENLLLGGKDFFNGDPKAALANLPAYVVNNVKVYEKQGEKSRTAGSSMGDEQYVMDVHLKRKYVGTYLGRLIAGYGTENRYQAGLFLMRFDDRQSFNLMGDFNNRSQSNEFGRRGQRSTDDPSGKQQRNYLAFNYQYEPHGRLRLIAGANYKDFVSLAENGESNEYFLVGGNTFGRTASSSRSHNMGIGGNAKLTLRPRGGEFYEIKYSAEYQKRDGRSQLRTANYAARPPKTDMEALLDSTFNQSLEDVNLKTIILSRLQQKEIFDGKTLQQQASAKAQHAFSGNLLNIEAEFSADNRSDNRYNLYDLYYNRPEDNVDFRNRYQVSDTRNYHYEIKASYDWKYRQTERIDAQLSPYYNFVHQRANIDNPLYRLDELGGEWADFRSAHLGSLPSVREELNNCLDDVDSYFSDQRTNKHLMGLNWRHDMQLKNQRWLRINAKGEVTFQKEQYHYLRNATNYYKKPSSWLPSPELRIFYHPLANDRRGMTSRWELLLSSNQKQVDLYHLIDIVDASDPLNVREGNGSLHNPWQHHAQLTYVRQIKKINGNLLNSLDFYFYQGEVALSSIYDRQSGVRTTRPVNVDGNWSAAYRMMFNFSLDKQQRWLLMPMALVDYRRNVDLSWTTGQTHSFESEVKSLNVTGGFVLHARPFTWFNFDANFKAEWSYIIGSRTDFKTIRATTIAYGVQTSFNLPAKFVLYANLAATSRFGFADSSLNDTRATIDVGLERTIKSFTLSLKGCDLLARNRYTTSILNAQGRTESFAICLPRYVMFSVTWKFNKVANRK